MSETTLTDQKERALVVLVGIAEDEKNIVEVRLNAAVAPLHHYIATVTNPF